jgi:hypothetical protein
MSVCPSVRVLFSTLAGRILMKFNIEDLHENLLRKFKFGCTRTKISSTVHEDLSTFYLCRQQKIRPEIIVAQQNKR